MEDQVTRLVDKAWERFQQTPQDRRFRKSTGKPHIDKFTRNQFHPL